MGSDGYIQLPVIDFSVLNNQNPDLCVYESIKTKVIKALQEYGCFHASIAGVAPELQESVYDSIKLLFEIPTETKSKNTSPNLFYGYIGNSPQLPLYESMGIDDPCIPEQVQNFTNLMWPQGNPHFSNDIQIYAKKLWELNVMTMKMVFEFLNLKEYLNEHIELTNHVLKLMKYRVPEPNEANLGMHDHADSGVMTILHQNEGEGLEILTKHNQWLKVKHSPNFFIDLDEVVRMMVLESLNLEKYMEEHMELTSYLVRVMKYRPPAKNESNMGLLSHADKNILTILQSNEVEGLEVQSKDGEWIKVKFSANSCVVMVGETFKGEKERFSIGLFSVPKWDKIIKAPEEMVDEEHPLLFKPFDYGEFFKFFIKEENINDKFALEKYCGVPSLNL
ncbi:hypothetical protein E3N88_05553 [Mikania micrantha]|uniref:Fe2OG dioxygenase domain-containing protein n=1 Tax=Mikania micrantha TaxID=192012 RepID=A0A5N6PNF0_9ASTR|nr:hypothetical protein E3N88_05553 [Mikania micrantha]